ncbi:MAG: HAMP domain-containing sensor histidine kinase [Alkalispirochaeta sp.]
MARTLIRLIFPQFALRMILIVVAMAAVIFLAARSYRMEMILNYSTNHATVLQAAFAHTEPKTLGGAVQWIRMVVSDTGPGVILFTPDGEAIFRHNVEISPASTSQLATAVLRRHSQITPRDTDALVIGAVVPLAIDQTEGEGTSAYLAVLNDGRELQQELTALALWLSLMVGIILLAVLLISYRVVRNIQSPLRLLQTTAASFAEGNLQSRSILAEPIEFYRLGEAMNSMAAQLSTRIDAIRNQRQQLEAILEAMVEGVLLVDGYHRITSMNPAAQRLFHTSELTNRRGEYRTLLEVIRNSELFDLVRSTFATASQQERRIVIYSNPPRHMQVHGTPLEIGGEPHALVVLNDITRLNELEQIRKEFVANVSHELKTPITSILGFVETLSEGALEETDQAHRFLDIIANQTHRLNAIIEDLLQLSRLEQNHEQITTEEVQLQTLCRRVRDNVQFRAQEKQIRIREYPGTLTTARAAGSLLEQAITNLVDNAITYCPDGSTIDLTFERDADTLHITVADDGPGIPYVDQPRLFERFYRVDRARSRSMGGTGLGLAIVKHIAQAHGGSVAVESVPGQGSAFRISIPQTTK